MAIGVRAMQADDHLPRRAEISAEDIREGARDMRSRTVQTLGGVALTTVLALVAIAPAVGQAGRESQEGLWPTGFSPRLAEADCGQWKLDENAFCVANDARNGLEVGVKFRTSTKLKVSGIRIYRVDSATVHGSLWEVDGTRLAKGTFADSSGRGWQDMSFKDPVTVVPGRTYIASYFTPATKYAFQHWYFRDNERTVGPVTAIRSSEDNPNGVHCYDDAACDSFPVRPYRDSSYFVTPLWVTPGTPGTPGEEPTDPSTEPTAGEPGFDTTAPRVTAFRPAGAKRARIRTNVKVKFSEPVRAASLTGSTVRLLRKGSAQPVRAVRRYNAARSQVVINPRSPLRPRTTYRVVVTSGVRDLAGNRLDQTTRAARQRATSYFRTR